MTFILWAIPISLLLALAWSYIQECHAADREQAYAEGVLDERRAHLTEGK